MNRLIQQYFQGDFGIILLILAFPYEFLKYVIFYILQNAICSVVFALLMTLGCTAPTTVMLTLI